MQLLKRIEKHLRRTGMRPARFGREAVGDPRFVFDLRKGREPRAPTVRRVTSFIERERESSGR